MLIKLLSKVTFFWAFILTSALGWGQCPTSVSISADPGTTICAGTPVTFTANPSGGGTYQYQWLINGNEVTGQTGSTFETSSLTNRQKVQVRVSSTTDNTTDCSKTSNEFVITVNPVQTPTVSINPTKTSICPGENITFQAANTYGGTNPQYNWYINSSNTVAKTGASATFSSSDFTEGNNSVRVVLTSNVNCASSPTAEATSTTFKLKPDATITTPADNEQSVCINQPIQNLAFALGGGATNATVTGLPPGVSGSLSGENFVISGSPTTKGTFAYTVTTTGTCAQTTATGTITVNPDATIALKSGSTSQTVCAAGGVADGSINPITYSIGETGTGASVTGLPTGIKGVYNSSDKTFTISGESSVTGTHHYSIKATGDCGSSAPLTGSIVINGNEIPSVSIASSETDNTICAGTSVTFTATPSNGGANPTYQWKIGSTTVGTDSNIFTTTSLEDGDAVTVEMSSSKTCISAATVTSEAITTKVNPNLTPEVTISTSDSDICPTNSVTFTAHPVNGGASPTYQWKVGNTTVGTNSPTFTTTELTDGQTVSVVLTSNETCLATATATSNSLTTTVQAPEPSTPGIITGPQEVCATATGLVYSIEAVTDAESYTWSLPPEWDVTAGSGTRSITVSASSTEGNISVAAVNSCGTSSKSSLAVIPVNAVPATPGEISSSLPEDKLICPPLDNLRFWITDTGADSYKWTLPSPGWEIVTGEGTSEITVRVTSATTNGPKEVKVEAVNICGNSGESTYSGIVVDTHIVASVGEDKTLCKTENSISINGTRRFGTANLKSDISTNGTGTLRNLPGNGSGDFTFQFEPSDADRNAGQVKITLNVPEPSGNNNSGNNCGSATDEMFIYFKPDAKITPPADPSPVVCVNSAIPPLEFILEGTLSGATATGLPTGVTGSYSSGKLVISGTPSVAGIFNYTVNTTGDCTQTSTTGTITVDELTKVEAGQAETDIVCQSTDPEPIPLTGSTFGGGATSAAWTITSGGGSLSSTAQTATPQNITYTPAASYTGDVVLTLTTNAPGKCAAVSATRTITVQPAPTVVAGTAATDIVCQSENPTAITLSGASFGGGATAAAWSITSGGGILSSTELSTSPQNVTYTPEAGYTGEVVLTLVSDAPGVCSAVNETRRITVEPAPTVESGEAATDIVCQSADPAAISLTGASFGGGASTAAWSITSGGGTLSSTAETATPENITYTPAANYTGEVVLKLTTNAPGTCASVNDTRIITVEPAAIVEAGGVEAGEEGGCQSATPGAITLSGASLGGGAVTAAWSITDGGGTLSSTAQTSQPELVTYTPAPDFTGTVTLTLTSAPAGNCSSVSDIRLIQISEALTIGAGEDIDLCSGSTITLSDITLGTGVTAGRWEIISGQGTLSSIAETANPGEVIFTAPDRFKGETVLRLTSNNPEGLCEAIYDERTINIKQEVTITTPPVNLGVCSTQEAVFEVVASGDNLTYQWFFEGAAIDGATDARLVIDQATSVDRGNYKVAVKGENSCGEPVVSEPVTLNVDEDIVIDTQPVGGFYCVGSTVNLSIEASAGGAELTYEWFNSSNVSVGTGATLALANVQTNDSGDYYSIITGPAGFTCSTVTSETVSIVVNPAPVIESIGTAIEICSVGEEVNITSGVAVSNESSITWSVPEGMGIITNPLSLTNAIYTPDGASGTVELTLTVQGLDGCSEVTQTKNITIIPQPVIREFSYISTNTAAETGEFCETDVDTYTPHTDGENLVNGTGEYSVSNTALIVDPNTGAITPNGTLPGDYIITYRYTSNSQTAGCTVAEKSFTVTIGEKPIATFSYENSSFCSNAESALPLMTNNAIKGVFSSTPSGLAFVDEKTGEIDIAASTPGTYQVTNTIAAAEGCAKVEATTEITITKLPIADFGYASTSYCSNAGNPVITLETDAEKGSFTSTSGLVFVDDKTGEIDIAASTPGNYTVTNTIAASEGCAVVFATADITITKLPVATFAYDQTAYCKETATNPTPTITGDQGGTFTTSAGLVIDPNTGVIDLTASSANDPNDDQDKYTITYSFSAANGCELVSESFEVRIDSQPVGGELKFAGLDKATYLVCHDATSGSSRAMELSGHYGKVIKWQKTTNPTDPDSWEDITHTEKSYSGYSGLTETTLFRAVLSSGSCGVAYSKFAVVSVIPANIKPDPVQADFPEICIGETVELTSELNYSSNTEIAEGGSFDNAQPEGWTSDSCKQGTNCISAGNSNTKGNGWALSSSNNQNWSGVSYASDGKFAIAHSVDYSVMETPVFSTFGLTTANLEFNHSYKLEEGSSIRIEISTDGGLKYDTTNPLLHEVGPKTLGPHNDFPEMSIELDEYVGLSNVRIRFIFDGKVNENENAGSSWAIDNIAIPDRPLNVASIWNYSNAQGEQITIENQQNITVKPDKIGLNSFKITSFLITDDGAECRSADPNNSETVDVYVFDKYTSTATATSGTCGQNEFRLNGVLNAQEQGTEFTFPTPDGYSAPFWKVEGPEGFSFKNPGENDNSDPKRNPNAIFVAPSPNEGTVTYKLTWAIERTVDDGRTGEACPPVLETIEIKVSNCSMLDFDGVDDFVDLGEGYTGDYSIEAWIRPEAATGTIISTPNLEINMGDLTGVTPNTRWYHIAVDSDGLLYIDGISTGTNISKTGTIRAFIGARWNAPNTENHFSGWIEEVRIWKGKIEQDQIRFLMNQRLQNAGNIGVEIPIEAPGLTYSSLAGYYQLLTSNILDGGYTPNLSALTGSVNGKLRNMEDMQENTAPLPYTTYKNGDWFDTREATSPWTHADVWDPPYSIGIKDDDDDDPKIKWNIAKVANTVTSGQKIKLLGLIMENDTDSEKTGILDMQGQNPDSWTAGGTGNPLHISHYLLLNGLIDLNGESQLVQPMGSIVDGSSSGYLDRDQQGTASSYNYNYWSSPVSPEATYNTAYTVGGVLMDGTTPGTPQGITFGPEYHFADNYTGSNRISTYWLFKFHGTADNYMEWYWVGADDAIAVGEGFSMKGTTSPAAIEDPQNYTFRGLPNNGDISPGATGPKQNYLVGNPYPSAIDAKKFIRDNMKDVPDGQNAANIFNGTVYFWSHFANKTHYLEQYIGGYAAYNLSGGVQAVANDTRIDSTGQKGGQIPQQFIPVGQAFFVSTMLDPDLEKAIAEGKIPNVNVSGGNVIFQNSQRVFVKEGSGDNGNSIFHSANNKNNDLNFASNDEVEPEQSKIWLKFKSPMGYHRQILVTADKNASDNFDLGYDAPLIEDNAEDMYWFFNDYEFVIQGVADFNLERELQIGMKVSKKGALTISIDELHNIPADMNIFLQDSLKQVVHDLREKDYHTTSEEGVFTDRFKIVFKDKIEVEPEEPPIIEIGDFEILYVNGTREILVRNPKLIQIKSIFLNNLMGQQIMKFYDIPVQEEVQLPVKRFSSGVYIIKVHSEQGISTKKVILE